MAYKCRICFEPMRKTKGTWFGKKGEINVGRIELWYCNRCGVILKELMMDYDKEQMKQIVKNFGDKKTEWMFKDL